MAFYAASVISRTFARRLAKMKFFKVGNPKQRVLPLNPEGLAYFKNMIKRLNGLSNLYRSLYDFTDEFPSEENCIIDKVFFDFDLDKENPDKCRKDALKLISCLKEENIPHLVVFSGRGFHVFLFIKTIHSSELQNPKQALSNVWDLYVDLLDIDVDRQPRGDLSRICKIPGTMNTKSKLFCIPLYPYELELPRKEICQLAKKPRKRAGSYRASGTNLIDLHDFDGEREEKEYELIESSNLDEINDKILEYLPLCVKAMLLNGDCNYQQRFAIITACRDLCYSKADTCKLLEKYLDKKKFIHAIRDENQVNYIFERQNLFFPTCGTIKNLGFCVDSCTGQNLYG